MTSAQQPDDDQVRIDAEVSTFFRENYIKVRRRLQHDRGVSQATAEDAAEEAFIIVRRKWTQVRDMDNQYGYLLKIARHEASRLARDEVRHDPLEDVLDELVHKIDVHSEFEKRQLVEHLTELSRRQKDIVWWRYWERCTAEETAEELGISVGNVKRVAADIRKILGSVLGWKEEDR